MAEHDTHNIEWKQGWRDEYLKWICGFANADGGTLLIGKDDTGSTVGVPDAKRLLEDIPNKIQMHLGIVCDVRPHEDAGGEYIEVRVDPSPYLWRDSFSIFRIKALESGRMTKAGLSCPDWELLDKLGLVSEGRLNRAGVLLFSHFPEKWVARCYTRIGYFSDEANVVFQDEVRGSLFEQVEKVMELLYSKYFVAPISYRGITRVERYAFPN